MTSVQTQLARIDTIEELEGFATMLRNPPAGIEVKPCTSEDWAAIAARKIEFQRRQI